MKNPATTEERRILYCALLSTCKRRGINKGFLRSRDREKPSPEMGEFHTKILNLGPTILEEDLI